VTKLHSERSLTLAEQHRGTRGDLRMGQPARVDFRQFDAVTANLPPGHPGAQELDQAFRVQVTPLVTRAYSDARWHG